MKTVLQNHYVQLILFFVVVFCLTQIDRLATQQNQELPQSTKNSFIVSFEYMHTHADLRIFIDGKRAQVPRMIGVKDLDGRPGTDVEGIQTFQNDSRLHIIYNPPVHIDDLMIKNFFESWGQSFTDDSFMGLPRDGKNLIMNVNGERTELYQHYPIRDNDRIVLFYSSITESQ